MTKNNNIFNGISTIEFMKNYWQKKPLLIRNAFPHFKDFLSKSKIISLACHRNAQARLVRFKKQWILEEGPFSKKDFQKIHGHWTLLVQGVNHLNMKGNLLLKNFNFIPYARLDDLMVSYAPDGGGVGPHFDSYDVFLLQGSGKRRWQIAKNKNFSLIPNIPLKIIENFKATEDWILHPGDMLYLPPNYAHHGVAVGESITYSIGFRAPLYHEILDEFLMFLQERFDIEGIYEDPELKATQNPGKITAAMIKKIKHILKKIQFHAKDIEMFYGRYVSEPKAHISFLPPKPALKKDDFLKLAQKNNIFLNAKTQLLYTSKYFFMNGEMISIENDRRFFEKLADQREIHGFNRLNFLSKNFLYEWYLAGFLTIKM